MFYWEDYLPVYMFIAIGFLMFSGYPVAFVLGGTAMAFGFIGWSVDYFSLIEFYNILPRVWGGAAENLVLVAVPCFIFMGTMLERSGIAAHLLHILQIVMRRVPGALALAVTVMGTIMAATTGIIGASVVMMTLLALPTMLERKYNLPLATGTIAASATLGILIPPSIMLVIMADLLALSVGNLFLGALFPGLLLSLLYGTYIVIMGFLRPDYAPAIDKSLAPGSKADLAIMLAKGFLPPVFLITLVLGSIFAGWATPTEAAGVGAFGAILLAYINRQLTFEVVKEVCERTALTVGMIFFIFIGATAFSYVFRSLGGEGLIIHGVEALGLSDWGFLIMLMILIFLLGFQFDWIEITLIVLPVFAPIVATLNFGDHIPQSEVVYWFAILMAVNLQTAFLSPPFGFALFYLKGVAPPGVTMQHIYYGICPFMALQLLGLAAVLAVPDIAMWLPRILLD